MVEAPARQITRCTAPRRAGKSSKNGASSALTPCLRVEALHVRQVLRAALLGHFDALLEVARQRRDGGRHDLGEDVGALAAAGNQQVERPARRRRIEPDPAQRRDRGADGVAHIGNETCAIAGDECGLGKGRGNRRGTAGEHPVGAAEHRVLLVQQARNAEPPAGHERRHRRVAAEAHGGGRPDLAQNAHRMHHRDGQPEHGDAARHGPAHARTPGRDGVSFDAPENVAEGDAPPIRHKDKTAATRFQLGREGLCREHVAASTACCEENGRVGRRRSQSMYPSEFRRSRVSASTIPRPTAVAIVDEPP